MSGNVHEAILVTRHALAPAIEELVLRLDPPAPLSFRAGQFVSLRVGEDAEGSAILRSYSIASPSGRDQISLVARHIPGGAATTWFERIAIGDRVRFTGPMGFFVLDLRHGGDVVFGATGVGIAPVMPMLDELLNRDETGKIHLFWGSRHRHDVFWREGLMNRAQAHPRLSVRVFITRDPAGSGLEAGRINDPIFELLPMLSRPIFYLVGSGPMIRDVKAGLIARGVDRKRQIRNEVFFA